MNKCGTSGKKNGKRNLMKCGDVTGRLDGMREARKERINHIRTIIQVGKEK